MLHARDRHPVLVLFDGSPSAECVLHAACRGVVAENASLVVLGVVVVPTGRAPDELPEGADEAVMRSLVSAMSICEREGVVAVYRETYAADLAGEILRVADETQATLIGLPLSCGGDPRRQLPSRTVQHVLAGAHCTVLLSAGDARHHAQLQGPR